MLFPPEELAKALPEKIGIYGRKVSAYQILLADGPHLTVVFGNLLAAAMKDHELHDGHPDSSSTGVTVRDDGQFAFTTLTPDAEITSYAIRVGQILTRSIDYGTEPNETLKQIFGVVAGAVRDAVGVRMSLKNSVVGTLLAFMRLGELSEVILNDTPIEGIDIQLEDHRLITDLRTAVASLDEDVAP